MRWFIASIFLLVSCCSTAQPPSVINFTNYTLANGLPEENINNITQDSRGFLWIGTREGLIRFDGQHYKTWYANPADSNRFKNNSISVISEYKPGYILFLSGSILWQVNIYNHRFEQLPRFKGKLITASPKKLNDSLWCLSVSDSVFIANKDFQVTMAVPVEKYYPANTIVGAFPIHSPYALLYTAGYNKFNLLNYYNGQITPLNIEGSKLDSRSNFFLPTAYDSSKKRLMLTAFFNGNWYIDLDLPQKTNYTPVEITAQKDGAVRKTILLGNNAIMQAGDNGLYITDFTNTSVFTTVSPIDKPIVSNTIVDIYQTRDGYYWLSTVNGISRFSLDRSPIKYWGKELQMSSNDEFKSILKGPDGNLYFLLQTNSLFKLNIISNTVSRLDKELNYCWSAIQSGNEIIATGAGKKLAVYNMTTGKTTYPSFLTPFFTPTTDVVTLVFKSKNGDIWYSANGGAGLIHNPAGTNKYIQYSRSSSPPAFSHSYVHSAAEDSHGNIWWCSNKNSQLLRWNSGTKKFEEYSVDTFIPEYKTRTGVSGLWIDAEDNLWMALDGAALLKYNLNKKRGSYYDINKGLPTDAVYAMCNDSKNRLWFGTRKGLCCYLPDRDNVVSFTGYDGFPDDNFESYGMFFDKDESRLYVGSKHSISSFNPDSLLSNVFISQPNVFIDEMRVNGKNFYFDNEKNILLGTKENNIEFSFAAPDFNRNNQIIFQYLLKGVGNEWVDLENKRTVTFNSLPHGKYNFSVRCKYKGTDTWIETAYPFTFNIKTPLVKTIWFRIIMSALFVILAWLLIRSYYRRKLEKQKTVLEKIQAIEKERTRIATDMHDDFGASLSRIKFISEKMQLTQKDDEALNKDLSKISIYSDEMAEKMNEIVWALNQRYDSIGDLVSFCRSYASEYLQDKNIKLQFNAGELNDKQIQGEIRRNIFLVIKEALNNIVKHSTASEVVITFNTDNDNKNIRVAIADNGKGIDKESIRPFANGLENMKKRMQDINGSFTVENNNGAKITISVPI